MDLTSDWARLPLFDRSKWQRMHFGDVAENLNETERDPNAAGIERFIGLEHLEPGSLHTRAWGNVADGTTFTRRCRPGQVLFGKRRAYQRKVAVAEFDAVVSGDIYVLAAKNDRLLSKLLSFLCLAERFFQHAVGTSAGSLSPRTNWSSLASFEFDLPPLDQQRRIAEILWAVDEVNQTSDWLLESVAKVRAAKTATLTDSSAFEKWPSAPLVESFDIVSGQVDPKEEPYRSMFLVAPNHIEQGSGRLLVTETAAQQNAISGKYLFQPGDVVYSKILPNLQKCFVAEFRGLCSADMYPLRPKQGVIIERYLLVLLLGEHFTSFAVSRCVRTGIPKINRVELGEYIAPIPKPDVQEKICAELEELDSVLSAGLENRRRRISMLSGMLTAFFGGAS